MREEEQRVIGNTPIITLPCITDTPPIMQARNPTSKRALKSTPRIHKRVTRNNRLGKFPEINRVHPIPQSSKIVSDNNVQVHFPTKSGTVHSQHYRKNVQVHFPTKNGTAHLRRLPANDSPQKLPARTPRKQHPTIKKWNSKVSNQKCIRDPNQMRIHEEMQRESNTVDHYTISPNKG